MDHCEARAGEYAHLRIAMGWGGAFVGCGSCSSRGVTATVQMRSAGSVRFIPGVMRALLRDVVGAEIRARRNLEK